MSNTKDDELYEDEYGFYFYSYDDASKDELYKTHIEKETTDYKVSTVK